MNPVIALRPRTLLATIVLTLSLAGTAFADGAAVVRDCTDDGTLSGRYSQSDYRDALSNLPTDVDEYTDCRDVIRRAQLGFAGGGGSGSGADGTGALGGGGTDGIDGGAGTGAAPVDPLKDATPQERAAFEKAVAGGSAPVVLDGRPVTPGALGGARVNDVLDLPTPLLVVLALLAAGAIAGAGLGARRLVLGRRTA